MVATQEMIARKAGVSQRLVSYALNGNGRVSNETRERLLQVAQELGHRPNKAARALAANASSTVQLLIPSRLCPFSNRVNEAMSDLARSDGFDLLVSDGSKEDLAQWPLDGLIVLGPEAWPDALAEAQRADMPIVGMGNYPCLSPLKLDYVHVNLEEAAESAMHHLVGAGCRRVAFLGAAPLMRKIDKRYSAYQRVMKQTQMKIELISITNSRMIRREAKATLAAYVGRHGAPDGILCGNDDTAIGALWALTALGLRVPDDVRLIGCDDIHDACDIEPPLSTIALPVDEMCHHAWQMLRQRWAQPELPPLLETLHPPLVLRASS